MRICQSMVLFRGKIYVVDKWWHEIQHGDCGPTKVDSMQQPELHCHQK